MTKIAPIGPLGTLLAGALFAAPAAAQSGEVVLNQRTGMVAGTTEFGIPRPPVVDNNGNWYLHVVLFDGTDYVLRNGSVIFQGNPGAGFVTLTGVEPGGEVGILEQGQYPTYNFRVMRWDGSALSELITLGLDISAVEGVDPGSTLTRVTSATVHSATELSVMGRVSSPGTAFDSFLSIQLDAQGAAIGGKRHATVNGPPPDGPGTNVQFLQTTATNSMADSLWTGLIQPGSRRQVFRNGLLAYTGNAVIDGLNTSVFPATVGLDYSDSGSWLVGLLASDPNDPEVGGMIIKDGNTFVKGGQNLPGFGPVRVVDSLTPRFLSGDFIAWIHRENSGPENANQSFVVESTRALTEGDIRLDDRFPADLFNTNHLFTVSPSGRYIGAWVDLQPGIGAAVIDLLGTPGPACVQDPDALAPNQSCNTAFDIGLLTDTVVFEELIAETGAADFLRVTVPPLTELTAETISDFEAADLDLYLYSGDCLAGNPLASNLSAADNPGIVWGNAQNVPVDVVLEIRVSDASQYPCGFYDLTFSERLLPICPVGFEEDPYEPNGYDDPNFVLLEGTYEDLYVFDSDEAGVFERDLFRVDVPAFATIEANYDHSITQGLGGRMRLRLRPTDENGTFDSFITSTTNPQGMITWTNNDPDEWPDGNPATVEVLLEAYWERQGTNTQCSLYDLEIVLDPGFGWSSYCGPANFHSAGTAARLLAGGSASLAANDLVLTAVGLPTNKFGYFVVSPVQGFTPLVGGSQGDLCVAGPVGRYTNQVQSSGSAGEITLNPDLTMTPTPSGTVAIQVGETWNYQTWFRDTNPAATSNFTDGVSVTFVQ